LKSIYLGDRACQSVEIDGWNSLIRIKVNCISRVRGPSGTWNYYTDEDIAEGRIVFAGVKSFEMQNAGYLPNDQVEIKFLGTDGPLSVIEVWIGSVDERSEYHDIVLKLTCEYIYLEDPRKPGCKIEG